jgi:hypothetical protein
MGTDIALTRNYGACNYREYNLEVGWFVAKWALGELLLKLAATGYGN